MVDDPSSVALPPSPLIVATLNNTDIKDVSRPETEMKNRQEMANFMLNDVAHDTTNCDSKTLLPGACSAAARPLFSLFATRNSIIKDVHLTENSSKNEQKLSNKSISDVDIQDQDNNMQSNGNTSLPEASLDLIPSLRDLLAKLDLAKGAAARTSKGASGSEVLPLLCMLLSWS